MSVNMSPSTSTLKPRSGAKRSTGSTQRPAKKSPSEQAAPPAPKPTPEQQAATEQAQQVPARAEQTQRDPDRAAEEQRERVEQAAKQQERQRDAQLKAGKGAAGSGDRSSMTVPEQRAGGVPGTRPVQGRVDNMTRRHDGEPLQGHFIRIDYSDADVVKSVKAQLAPEGSALAEQGFEPGIGSADYGVYLQPGQLGEDGYPETAVVMLRDEHAAQIVVPYAALVAAGPGGR